MSRAPLPALRALFASGGAPLALVRKDEQLAERLLRMVRDDVPAIVEQGVRAARVLTAVPDIGQLVSSIELHANEASDARHDERAMPPLRPRSRVATHEDERAGGADGAHAGDDAALMVPRKQRATALSPDFVAAIKAAVSPTKERPKQSDDKVAERDARTVREVQAAIAASRVTVGKAPKARRLPFSGGAGRSATDVVATSAARVARILSQFEKGASTSRKSKEGEREATRNRATTRGEARAAVASVDAMMTLVRRLEQRGSKEYDARRHKVLATRQGAIEEYVREGRGAPGGGATLPGPTARGGERSGTRLGAAHDAEHYSTPVPAMSEPAATVGGFRGLARWAADLSGDAELSSSIARADGERAPMLQQLHVARRSWSLDGDALALSLDSAARNEGIDLDEVAS